MVAAAIFGIKGEALTPEERAFFGKVDPYGYILFARNCANPEQIRALTAELEQLHGRSLPILIDQEGGRVARLRPPHWRETPSAARLAERGEEAVYLNARLTAHELSSLGITVNCAPVADIPVAGAHAVIGERAYGDTPEKVIALASACAKGLLDGGIVPVLKHIPGHGRATVDSHEALPVVETPLEVLKEADFAPFHALAHLPMAMTAHVVYTAIDARRLATVSPAVVRLIREDICFTGLLMTDDLSMKAMTGNFARRTAEALEAGCDVVLHCNGDLAEMREIASALPGLSKAAEARSERAFSLACAVEDWTPETAKERLDALLAA